LNSIKYIRIVGSGHLGFSLDFTSKPVKHDGQVVFINMQLTLNGSYGVMDIREGKMIVNCEYKFINILPWAIQHSTGDKSSYFTKKLS
jgi:glucose dehydrogenase